MTEQDRLGMILRAPADRTDDRKRAYFGWARRVVDGLRGIHPGLERAFDEPYGRSPV